MKISRLKVWSLAVLLAAGTISASAQDEDSAGITSLDFTLGSDAQFVDVFGIPTLAEDLADVVPVDVADSTVYADGAGKLSGFALLSVDTEAGTHSDIVATVSGSLSSKSGVPQVKMTIKGKGASTSAEGLTGKATISLKYAGSVQTTVTPAHDVTNSVATNICADVPLTNCGPVVSNFFTAITNVSQITSNTIVETNNPIVTTNYLATNLVHSSDNTTIATNTTIVINVNHPWFTVATTVTNLCTQTTNCADYTNVVYTGVASTNGLATNVVVFTSSTSQVNTNTSTFPRVNGNGTVTTNTTPINGQFLFSVFAATNDVCAPVTTTNVVTTTNSIVTTTNTYAAITNTADLTGTGLVTNTAATFGTNIYVRTNNTVISTNGLPGIIVAGAFVTNTFTFADGAATVSAFRLTSASGTNNVTVVTTNVVAVLTNVCTPTNVDVIVHVPESITTEMVGKLDGSYKSGVKGDSSISIKGVTGTIGEDGVLINVDSPVSVNVVFLNSGSNGKLDAVAKIDVSDTSRTTLPFTGTGSVNNKNSKVSLKLKGVAEAKGSSLKINGTANTAEDVDLTGSDVSGKILGQSIKSKVNQ